MDSIVRALDTDLEWVRSHTRVLMQAREWESSGRRRGRLLRRAELRSAEAWLSAAPKVGDTHPTELQTLFIHASRRAATRNVTSFGALALAVALGAIVLAAVALRERDSAREASRVALSRELAARAASQLDVDPELALLLAVRAAKVSATPEAALALRRALATDRLVSAARTRDGYTPIALSPDGRYAFAAADEQHPSLWKAARLLDARTGRTIRVLKTDGRLLSTAEFTRDSKRVMTEGAGRDRIWTVPDGRLLATVDSPNWWFTPDGSRAAIVFNGSGVAVWDVATVIQVRVLGDVQPPGGFAFDAAGSRAVEIDNPGTEYVWDTTATSLLARYPSEVGHQWTVAAFSPKSELLATGSVDGSIALRRTLKAKPVRLSPPAKSDASGVVAIAFSPDGSQLAVAHDDGNARVWRVRDGLLQVELPKTTSYTDIEFSPDGRRIVTASIDGTARLFDATSGAQLLVLHGHAGRVTEAHFSADGKQVSTLGLDGIRTWDVGPAATTVLRGMSGNVDAQFAPDDRTVVATDFDATQLFALSGRRERRLAGHESNSGVKSAMSPDGRFVASVASDGRVLLYSPSNGWRARRLRFAGHGQAIDVRFSADGHRLLAIFALRTDLYDIPSGKRIGAVAGAPSTYSADLSQGLIWRDGKIELVDLASGKTKTVLPGGSGVLSPDGSLAAAASATRVEILDVDTGKVRSRLPASAQLSVRMFSSDGTRILTTDRDGSVGVWTAADGHQDTLLVSHENSALEAALNADGSLVALGGAGFVRLYDAATGVVLETFPIEGGQSVFSLAFGGVDDDFILVGHAQDGKATLIRCAICRQLPALVELANTRVTRGFTDAERQRFLHEK